MMQERKVRVAKNIRTCDEPDYSYGMAQRYCSQQCQFIKIRYDDNARFCYLFFDSHGNIELKKHENGQFIRPDECVSAELSMWGLRGQHENRFSNSS